MDHYNYFSDEPAWERYAHGHWYGIGISMFISEREPYEQNLQTSMHWNLKNKVIQTSFKRDHKTTHLQWNGHEEILADKIKLMDTSGVWRAEIQTMTANRFHLHVQSVRSENQILFSGIMEKSSLLRQLVSIFF